MFPLSFLTGFPVKLFFSLLLFHVWASDAWIFSLGLPIFLRSQMPIVSCLKNARVFLTVASVSTCQHVFFLQYGHLSPYIVVWISDIKFCPLWSLWIIIELAFFFIFHIEFVAKSFQCCLQSTYWIHLLLLLWSASQSRCSILKCGLDYSILIDYNSMQPLPPTQNTVYQWFLNLAAHWNLWGAFKNISISRLSPRNSDLLCLGYSLNMRIF